MLEEDAEANPSISRRKSLMPGMEEYENQAERRTRVRVKRHYELSVNERGVLFFLWSSIVAAACVYNWVFICLIVFETVREDFYDSWIRCNIISDAIFLVDIFVQSRKSFYEDGVKITTYAETRANYVRSREFFLDLVSILPTDLFLMMRKDLSLFRSNRFLKTYRLQEWFRHAESRFPRWIVVISQIILVCALLFHWNACAYYILSLMSDETNEDAIFEELPGDLDDDDENAYWPFTFTKITDVFFTTCDWWNGGCALNGTFWDETSDRRMDYIQQLNAFHDDKKYNVSFSNFAKEYSLSIYWSSLTMTTLGEQPAPNLSFQSLFEIFDTLLGVLIFAVIMGSVGELVASANAVRAEMQFLMDGLKQYMKYRNLGSVLQQHVLTYVEYEMNKESLVKEDEIRAFMPEKMFVQVNSFIQWKTLKRSPLFEGCERALLSDLAKKMYQFRYAPNDLVASRGDLNKEMYVICSGDVTTTGVDGYPVVYTAGDIIGDRSLMWAADHRFNNCRHAEIRTTGYAEIYILHRDDLLEVLNDYSNSRLIIATRARVLMANAGELDMTKTAFIDEQDQVDTCETPMGAGDFDQRLKQVERIVREMEWKLDRELTSFQQHSQSLKQRVFELELVYKEYKQTIRRDCIRECDRLD